MPSRHTLSPSCRYFAALCRYRGATVCRYCAAIMLLPWRYCVPLLCRITPLSWPLLCAAIMLLAIHYHAACLLGRTVHKEWQRAA
ncbi:hypothetical protein [Paenibacillus sp. SYP-B4298]|uniref:hypothetical protein n=1 Tax=Paenibacillus sp. SYP-B4298 TaxID=2996034 RepID=UPI0022DE160D|nr:hypothetical protein [Paenibacillus sp. SYP-B4298]